MTISTTDIETFVVAWLKEELEQDVDCQDDFATVGIDSLDAVRLTDDLADFIGVEELPVSLILDHPTTAKLAEHISSITQNTPSLQTDAVQSDLQ